MLLFGVDILLKREIFLNKTGVGNLRPAGQMWPVWTFDMVRIRIIVTQGSVQHRVKLMIHDKQVLGYTKSR